MELRVVQRAGPRVSLELRGRLVGPSCAASLERFLEEHYVDDGVREITIDLSRLREVDDDGIRTFETLRRQAEDRRKQLLLERARGEARIRLAAAGLLPRSGSGGTAPGGSWRSRTFDADPVSLLEARRFVRDQCRDGPLGPTGVDELALAVSEACTNAVLHSGSLRFRVRVRRRETCVEVVVHDHGVYRNQLPTFEVIGEGGRGILLMMAMVDEVTIRQGTPRRPGTAVRIVKCREP